MTNIEREQEVKSRYQVYLAKRREPVVIRKWGWTPWWIVLLAKALGIPPFFSEQKPGISDPVEDDLALNGRLVFAHLVMANSALFSPGKGSAPCLAIFAFDDQDCSSVTMMGIANRLYSLKDTAQTEPDLAEAAVFVTDEAYMPYRRRMVPKSLTGGKTVYAVDLAIMRSRLADGYLNIRILPCLASAGDAGPIVLLPHDLLAGLV